MKSRLPFLIGGALVVAVAGAVVFSSRGDASPSVATEAWAGEAPVMTVYKSPTCGCCGDWVDHMREAGFEVVVRDTAGMAAVKTSLGVPAALGSCHTATVDGYVVEGHVPAAVVRRVLEERPAVAGVAVPGMPIGSPGMEVPGRIPEPFDVFAFTADGQGSVYQSM